MMKLYALVFVGLASVAAAESFYEYEIRQMVTELSSLDRSKRTGFEYHIPKAQDMESKIDLLKQLQRFATEESFPLVRLLQHSFEFVAVKEVRLSQNYYNKVDRRFRSPTSSFGRSGLVELLLFRVSEDRQRHCLSNGPGSPVGLRFNWFLV